ncbi:hypothetical protein HDV05_002346 [Chytridiales sp. JEL 0842]|nr:hypothetical protein HDV05_002346 [Chytridiales sp. JEL 0842]
MQEDSKVDVEEPQQQQQQQFTSTNPFANPPPATTTNATSVNNANVYFPWDAPKSPTSSSPRQKRRPSTVGLLTADGLNNSDSDSEEEEQVSNIQQKTSMQSLKSPASSKTAEGAYKTPPTSPPNPTGFPTSPSSSSASQQLQEASKAFKRRSNSSASSSGSSQTAKPPIGAFPKKNGGAADTSFSNLLTTLNNLFTTTPPPPPSPSSNSMNSDLSDLERGMHTQLQSTVAPKKSPEEPLKLFPDDEEGENEEEALQSVGGGKGVGDKRHSSLYTLPSRNGTVNSNANAGTLRSVGERGSVGESLVRTWARKRESRWEAGEGRRE